jgi:hypothetical protein
VPLTPIKLVCTADAVKFPTTLTDSDEAFKIGEPLTKSETLLTLV